MFDFVCGIPGADASTAAWHAAIHLGLAAFIVTAGLVFLALALVTYRRTAPAAEPVRTSVRLEGGPGEPPRSR